MGCKCDLKKSEVEKERERERQQVEVREIKLNKKVITHLFVPLYYWNGNIANAKIDLIFGTSHES